MSSRDEALPPLERDPDHARTQDESQARLQGMARGGVANLAGAGVTAVAQFGLTVLLTRSLSAVEVGAFFTATSFFLLVTVISNVGANTGLVYFLSRLRAHDSQELIPAYLRTAFLPVTALSMIAAAILFLWAPQVAAAGVPDAQGVATGYLRAVAAFIPLASLESLSVAACRGMGTMRANVVVSMVLRPLTHLALCAVAVIIATGSGVGVAWGLAYVPAAALAVVLMRRTAGRPARSRRNSVAGPFWRYTRPRAVTSIIQITIQRFDILLVAALGGAAAAGVYAAATRFVVVGQMASNALAMATEPRVAGAIARRSLPEIRVIYRTTTAWLMLLTWPIYLILIIYPVTLLTIFGSGYDVGAPVVALVSCAMLISTSCGLVDTILAMSGRTGWNLANALAGLAIQLTLGILLIPSTGYVGAAIAWAASIAFRNLTGLVLVRVSQSIHPTGAATALAGGLALVAFGAIPFAVHEVVGEGWVSLGLALVLGSVVHAAGAWVGRETLQLRLLGNSLSGRLRGRGRVQEA